MKKYLFSHPHGAPFVREAALALIDHCGLTETITTIAFRTGSLVTGLLPGRCWIPRESSVKRVITPELARLLLIKSGLARALGIRDQRLTDAVYAATDRCAAGRIGAAAGVYCYEDGALETFRVARRLGRARVYDLPIMYHKEARAIEEQEADRFPELRQSLLTLSDGAEKQDRKTEELMLASEIIVASDLTKRSIEKHSPGLGARISVVPYGSPRVAEVGSRSVARSGFTVLFLGRVGPRKGVHHLLRAWNRLRLPGECKLILAGINEFSPDYLRRNLGTAHYAGVLNHAQAQVVLDGVDLLVLPSLVEGFGLVILEAMSRGVPVLASTNTALPEIVNGSDAGFCIPPGDTESLEAALEKIYRERTDLPDRSAANRRIAQEYSWSAYRTKLGEVLRRAVACGER